MSAHDSEPTAPTARQLAHLRNSSRVTPQERTALEAAETDEAREGILRTIRARHAAERLRDGLSVEAISVEEAEHLVEEVRQGKHSSSLRRRINQIAGRRARRDGTA
jgi:hypothetical protein